MHRLMIFLTIFILVESTKTTNRVEPAKSELQLFVDNFRILSRVTNAIHLQSVFAKKNFKIDDLLSELLEVTPDRFNTLMNLPINLAKLEVNRMYNTYRNTTVPEKVTNEEIREAIHVIDVLKTLETNIAQITESSKMKLDPLLQSAKAIQKYKMFDGPCEKLKGSALQTFRKLFPADEDIFSSKSDDNIAKDLKTFRNEIGNFIACLDSLETMDSSSNETELLMVYNEYKPVGESFKTLLDFAILQKKDETIQHVLPKIFYQIKGSHPIWSRSQKNEKVKSAMGHLQQTFAVYKKQLTESEYSTPPKINTAGFRSSEDLSMVFDNLKSNWFIEKVAQNKSSTELESALNPFKNLYTSISALGASWKKLRINELKRTTQSETILAAERLKNITEFSNDSSRNLKILHISIESVQTCLESVSIDLPSFFELRGGYQSIDSVVKRFLKLNKEMTSIKNHILYPSYEDQKRNFYYKDLITSINTTIYNVKPESASLTLNSVRELIDRHMSRIKESVLDKKIDFLDGLDRLANLLEKMRKLKEAAKNLKNPVSLDLLLQSSNVSTVLGCLENGKFDASTLQFSAYVADALLNVPDHSTVAHINEFLEHLRKIQLQYTSVVKVFKDSSRTFPSVSTQPKFFKKRKNFEMFIRQLGENILFIENMEKTRNDAKLLPNISEFPEEIREMIEESGLKDWVQPFDKMKKLLKGTNRVVLAAKNFISSDIVSMEKVFEEAATVHGIPGARETIAELYHNLSKSHLRDKKDAVQYFGVIHKLDLDFSRHESRLRNSRLIIEDIKKHFDEIFGNLAEQHSDVQYIKEVSWVAILGSCVGLFLLLLIGALLFYGMTENGRTKYANLWMYYFGSKEDFDKRWRYCRFLDYSNGRNHMLEAVREVNTTNLLKALKAGVYINAYNRHGNTALHVATKLGHPELVKILIKHGADRTLLNGQNRTPEQMIIAKSTESLSDKPAEIKKIQKIYNKYRKKKFRLKVPAKFPESSFHIWIDEEVNVDLYNKFVARFQSISSDEMSTATHCVVKTDKNGVLHTDSLDLLSCIFHGIIIVRDTWLTDSLADESLIMEDSRYLVESVMYKGTTFDTVLKWSEAMAKGTMPFLYGVYVAAVMTEYDNLYTLTSIVESQGGMVMDQFPLKKYFNKNTHPYLHAHLGPIFLIHDGSINLKLYKNDPDKMYTLFTEQEFISFLLKREINRDTRENLVTVLKTPKK
ncbi:unnamed protein product [Caenorhabditis brenneri]